MWLAGAGAGGSVRVQVRMRKGGKEGDYTARARYKNVRLKMSALRLQLHSTTGGDMEGERTFCEVEATAKLEIAVVKEASAAADVLNRGFFG